MQVRVKIEQELSLTRVGFLGSLELTNSGERPLTDVSVELSIYKTGDLAQESRLGSFVIGDPSPTFKGGVDGNGTIANKSSGVAEWLFMPLRDAGMWLG